MRGRLIIVVLALVAVAVAFAASGKDGGESEAPSRSNPDAATANALHLSFAYSPEKEDLLVPLIRRFNSERHSSGGRTIFVDRKKIASGEAERKIANGSLEPTMWSPASSFWGRLLNYEADQRLVADENPSIVRTPLVLAMWEQLADAYGYPERKLGYEQLNELATEGWSAVGKPEFGAFKYVHTNPDFSTSGLSAVAASYYAAAGKKEGLTEADVTRARPTVRRLERSIVHYGETTLLIEQEMSNHGLGYASAAAMEETTLISLNQAAGDGDRLVAVYPEEGTFVSDNPLMTLHGDWVSDEQRAAARTFAAFLAEAITPETAGREGFRPADESIAPAGLVTRAMGVDPKQPEHVLRLPEPRVLVKLKAAWRADRKPANVMVVFDRSDSMGSEDKLIHAKEALIAFFRQAEPQDRIGLIQFSSEITPLVPIAAMKANRAKLIAAASRILPDGDTRVRDATIAGVRAVDAKLDSDAVNAVVVLTDGQDTTSSRSATQVVEELERLGRRESDQIRMFTIAYGSDANEVELKRFAEASGGQAYKGGTHDIRSVYDKISSYF